MLENSDPGTLEHVGASRDRREVTAKLTGEAVYASDMWFPGMLYAQVRKSPHARARIRQIDTSRAEALSGVRAVLTGAELAYRLGLYIVDKHILAKGEGGGTSARRWRRSPPTRWRSRGGLSISIEVDYEVLPAVLNHMDALKDGAPLVHPDLGRYDYVAAAFTPVPGTNIANLTRLRKGDVEQGFAEAEWVVEREYHEPVRPACPDGDARGDRGVADRRSGHDLVECAVALHRAQPVLPRVQAAAQPGAGDRAARRRRVRRQGGHPPSNRCARASHARRAGDRSSSRRRAKRSSACCRAAARSPIASRPASRPTAGSSRRR